MDFGTRLKLLRTQQGLTQAQLANQIGATKSLISFYELRDRSPSPEILIKLSQVFHVTTDYLLGIDKGSYLDVSGLCDEDISILIALVASLKKKAGK